MTEKELVDKIKRKDQQAFKVLVDKYHVAVINTCMGYLHNRSDAEDLAQEVFLQAYLSINKFREDASISTWLFRIAVNKSLNHLRDNQKRRNEKTLSLIQSENTNFDIEAGPESGSDYKTIESERKKNLHLAIDSLPENQKTAFILHKYDDLPYVKIAEIMNVSVSSVESLLFRARKKLQKKLHDCYKKLHS
jgi:RNA polymerase sigma-70 factor, ECF subfamily